MDTEALTPDQRERRREGTLSSLAYKEIKKRIFTNQLHQGSKIAFSHMSTALGVSRTPIREALERLCEEGFVLRHPNRGYYVAQIEESEVDDLFSLREALEIYALRRSCERGLSDEQLEEIKRLNDRYAELIRDDSTRERMMVDRDFHLTLASFAGNRALLRALDMGFERLILKLNIDGYSSSHGDQGLCEHQHLVCVLTERRYDEALSALAEHIKAARGRVLLHLGRLTRPEFYGFEGV